MVEKRGHLGRQAVAPRLGGNDKLRQINVPDEQCHKGRTEGGELTDF